MRQACRLHWQPAMVPYARILAVAMVAGLAGCGKPAPELSPVTGQNEQMIPVIGAADFGTQCPYGTLDSAVATPLQLWHCPIGLKKLQLDQSPPPLYFQADCTKKILSARTTDRSIDSSWEVMPDNSFAFTLTSVPAQIADDGAGHVGCSSPMTVNIWGKLDCTDRDKIKISLESVWWPGKGANSSGTCSMPSSCYFYATNQINQCQ
jgi:hypothetical protein